MGKRVVVSFGLVLFLVLCFSVDSFADPRRYVWTYEYSTPRKGEFEIEDYVTTKIPDKHKSNINTVQEWLEFEYGITDRWDVAMYQMYKFKNKANENDGKYDGFKVRTRYRFGEKGKYIVDPLIYLEYIRDPDFSKPNVIEEKLILAKDVGNFNISYNQILERNLDKKGKGNNEYAAGISYTIFRTLKFGIEGKGSFNERENFVGPAIGWEKNKFWFSLGAAFGINRRSDDLQTRIIVGYEF